MTWINVPKDIDSYEGFVYCVTELDTGMRYYGIKKFWKTVKYPPLKGKKNKRWKKVESDWNKYNTSSPELQRKIAVNPSNYEKKIIKPCSTVTEMKANEAFMQLSEYLAGNWGSLYNEVINLRLRIR